MSLEKQNKSVSEGLSEVQAEKLFWRKVAEEIKETDFRRIYETIFPDIESGNYALARQALKEELRKIIAEKNPAMYSNTDQRGSALLVLKEEFYKLFPEIEDLLEETEEERRAKIKRPTGQLGESEETPSYSEEEFREPLRDPYLVEEKNWEVPKERDLIPGLTIIFTDKENGRSETIEFVDWTYVQNGDFYVRVKWNGENRAIRLADFGLVPYNEVELWNSRYIPTHWELKKENK
ncbi:MAG: hypothetical protein Q7R84_01185 [bacterium]|nr:hypothetical protein [bacterium]